MNEAEFSRLCVQAGLAKRTEYTYQMPRDENFWVWLKVGGCTAMVVREGIYSYECDPEQAVKWVRWDYITAASARLALNLASALDN